MRTRVEVSARTKKRAKETHAHVLAAGVGIHVVRVDVEGQEAEGGQAGRLHDAHVVGGADVAHGHVGAGTAANVGHPVLDHSPVTLSSIVIDT